MATMVPRWPPEWPPKWLPIDIRVISLKVAIFAHTQVVQNMRQLK